MHKGQVMHAKRMMSTFNRRRFLQSAAAVGAGLAFAPAGRSGETAKPDQINVALLGAGAQGMRLMNDCLRIAGVRFKAVCDIWQAYNLKRASRALERYGHAVTAYADYEEMLDQEKDLDAVIVATPDFWHARHGVACLNKGLHVYCESPISNTLEGARSIVKAARKAGRLLQVGHHRRSNPRYILCREKLLNENRLLGQIVAAHGQWNRASQPPLGWPRRAELDEATLHKYGYKSMNQFANWRWYKGLGGGPLLSLGSLQIDVYNWFLVARPTGVLASGCTNYYRKEDFEWPDTVMAICEYDTPQGPIRAYYQILSANRSFGYFEAFLGDQGALVISELSYQGEAYKEPAADESTWTRCVEMGYLKSPAQLRAAERDIAMPMYVVGESPPPLLLKQPPYKLAVQMDKPYHQPHLENFFDAIRGKAKLNCPAEVGYETAVTVLKISEALQAGCRIALKPGDFIV
jgi:predicted dehydrogenase